MTNGDSSGSGGIAVAVTVALVAAAASMVLRRSSAAERAAEKGGNSTDRAVERLRKRLAGLSRPRALTVVTRAPRLRRQNAEQVKGTTGTTAGERSIGADFRTTTPRAGETVVSGQGGSAIVTEDGLVRAARAVDTTGTGAIVASSPVRKSVSRTTNTTVATTSDGSDGSGRDAGTSSPSGSGSTKTKDDVTVGPESVGTITTGSGVEGDYS